MKLKDIRLSKNMSQIDFAKKCGLSQSELSMLESGTHKPNYITIKKIAKTLKKSEEEVRGLFNEDNK